MVPLSRAVRTPLVAAFSDYRIPRCASAAARRHGGISLLCPVMLYHDIAGRRTPCGEGPTMAHDDDDLKADIAERRPALVDRKSTRLYYSPTVISHDVICL